MEIYKYSPTKTEDSIWVIEHRVFYLYGVDWCYLIENEVERWLLEMKLWANKN